ncbi:DNA repair protein RecO [Candidatus Thiothrix anitrata]|uniref:DNA repair protein RecO n=1 Tax=Candidatus Thiothrix anitrata TaxID=2823902 RepID=A0ABX7X122_9GAMM|nr:DNA repair protein RecO [Candidatus Thiothrix anitrata]QTR49585.1 DNA repair protein RecO [Candidatus Thiothrix anitrata]
MLPPLSPAFILRRNPYRDTSVLLDLFTLEAGKITCVAKFGQGKNSRSKGMLEPFRQLDASWTGKGEVFTLFNAEEKRRFPLKAVGLIRAVYANELLLRALWQHQPQPELFAQYQQTLFRLENPADVLALPLFELDVLAMAGYVLNLWHDDAEGHDIEPAMRYRFHPDQGLYADAEEGKGVPISGNLLIALREPEAMNPDQRLELRHTLDYLIQMLLKGKTLNARKLFHE